MKSKTLDIEKFIQELSETHCWSNTRRFDFSRSLRIYATDTPINNETARFFRLTEISTEEEVVLRQNLENVIACLDNTDFRWVYYISGTKAGIELYLGVVRAKHLSTQGNVCDYAFLLKSQLQGNLTGAQLEPVAQEQLQHKILTPLKKSKYFGLLHGVPSITIDQQTNTATVSQGVDRLTRALVGDVWQLLIVTEPATEQEINQQLDQLLQLASDLHPYIKRSSQESNNRNTTDSTTKSTSSSRELAQNEGTSNSTTKDSSTNSTDTDEKGKNSGGTKGDHSNNTTWGDSCSLSKAKGASTSDSRTIGDNKGKSDSKTDTESTSYTTSSTQTLSSANTLEYVNKKIERVQTYISDTLIERFDLGRSKGMFRTAIYLAAPNQVSYDRLAHGMVSIFQGNQSHFSPLKISTFEMTGGQTIDTLFQVQRIPMLSARTELALIHSTPTDKDTICAATWLNASELSLLAGLPTKEVAGIRLRKNVDFAVNPINPKDNNGFDLGFVVQHGRELEGCPVRLDKELLNQHIFICGVTGSGKTTTCQQILLGSTLPFVVIEPAKTEYRSLSKLDTTIQFYTLGNEKLSPFRFNPFELLPKEQLSGHIDMLKATFAAVFPMEAAMPYLIEEAIVRSYEAKGWDIHDNQNYYYADPWQCQGQCWPIMSDLLEQLKKVIASKGFGKELQEKYEGSLIARLDNLTVGTKGRMLNTRNSIDIDALLDQKVVFELEDLRDEQDKALMMGFLVGRIAEAVKQRQRQNNQFRHLTLLEEAHRLLSKHQAGDNGAKRLGVDLFANLLAEVRKYGEGLIIADQIPNKLTPEVMKNTNTKIVHRLFAADDRHTIGDTITLNDEQKDFLAMLQTGEAVVYSAGWHEAVRVKILKSNDTNAAAIDEQLIAKMGEQRLYEQRHRLYPRLSAITDWTSAVEFRQFTQSGLRTINAWIRWFKQQNTQNAKLLLSIMRGLRQQYPSLGLHMALVALFEDVVPISNVADKLGTQLTLAGVLTALLRLSDAAEMPQTLGDDSPFGLEGRVIFNALTNIFKSLTAV
ncbi:MAG: ATP-binding protein [Gammaproteobacteria bacterium]|nr:ATP-binding protein [Gammaproteobacteria bacterium]